MVIWGKPDAELGEDEEVENREQIEVVWFDAKSGKRLGNLKDSVPSYKMSTATPGIYPYPQAKMVVSNERIFLWGNRLDFSVWNMQTGQCEATKEAFHPDLYHVATGLFLVKDEQGHYKGWRYN